ncbi:octopamine receptor beta-2R-like [Anneissia japonica]|uniref:octopamine receptor beta-2R-like n=1 Tax=Anneissia japonica TaxID=1529436 RepID=UPI001425B182|nr:octopamine receptor beta-2R-like [Anneissia japonica]
MFSCEDRNVSTMKPASVGYNASTYLLTVIGIFANLTVVIVFINCKIYRRSFTYLLVFQQSIFDMIACFLYPCFHILFSSNGNFANYCKFGTLFFFCLSASTLNLVFISVERYIAVVHPLKYWIRGNQMRSNLPQLCIPLVAAFLITFQYAFILEEDQEEPGKCTFCYKNKGFEILSGTILLLANGIIPISTMTFCYYRVYITLKKQNKIQAELTNQGHINNASRAINYHNNDELAVEINISPSQTNQKEKAKNQRNFIITMSINTLVFTICLTPVIGVYLVYTICKCFDINYHISSDIATFFVVFSMVANPFIYAYKLFDFKEGFSKTFCRQC